MDKIFVIGGCRSGKSRRALELARQAGGRRVYVATLEPRDGEMRDRVKRHQAERGKGWRTVEESVDLAGTLAREGRKADVIVVDCLTLWVSNLLLAGRDIDAIVRAADDLAAAVRACPVAVILVSNEVGGGVVPDNALGRAFRDAAGLVNQRVAAVCSRVELMVAGIPLAIKPGAPQRTTAGGMVRRRKRPPQRTQRNSQG
ncbi:MAG: bifunctional adenosylcobinamide kinase/adenosylcobinamide-phosphate guanylyltransferase [Planctomycetota bacterium]